MAAKHRQHALYVLRLRGPVSTDDRAKALHYLLLALFAWYGLWTIVLLPYSTGHPPQLTAISLIEAALAAALVTLRLGSLRAASWIYLCGVWIFATVVIAQNGGIRSAVVALFVTVPVSAAWLLGYRASFWTTGVCIVTALVFALLESASVRLPRTIPGTAIGIWIQITGAVLMGVIPLTQVLRKLTEALIKIRQQFEALQRQADQLRESEGDLRTSEVQLKEAQRLAKVGSFERHIDSAKSHWSDEIRRIFGLPNDAAASLPAFVNCVHPQDREKVLEAECQVRATRAPVETEYRIIRPDGEVRLLRTITETITNDQGLPVRIVGATQDITDSRRAQEESFARQKLKGLGVLASGIAHDFNNLLGGILAEAELVEADLTAGLPPGDEIATIKAVAIRGSEIVRQLMIYAGQNQAESVEPVDLSKLVEEIVGLLKVSISKRALLKTNLDKNLPIMWCNAPQIRQVVMNLVINASEAIGEKEGVIRIATSRVTVNQGSRLNNAANLPSGEYVQLEVSDTGRGMTEETRAKIFDPFFSTKFVGRGLGLAVVQGIVRDHGGALDVVSTPGHGATFRVLLSCASKEALGTQSAHTSSAGEQSQSNAAVGTILLVEDEEVLRLAVSKALRKKGFSVLEACDGSAAMELISTRADDIDAVLLDVSLPGISCREILEEAARIRPGLRVIFTSAYDKETISTSFPGLRVERFIRKPFQIAELVDELQNALSA